MKANIKYITGYENNSIEIGSSTRDPGRGAIRNTITNVQGKLVRSNSAELLPEELYRVVSVAILEGFLKTDQLQDIQSLIGKALDGKASSNKFGLRVDLTRKRLKPKKCTTTASEEVCKLLRDTFNVKAVSTSVESDWQMFSVRIPVRCNESVVELAVDKMACLLGISPDDVSVSEDFHDESDEQYLVFGIKFGVGECIT